MPTPIMKAIYEIKEKIKNEQKVSATAYSSGLVFAYLETLSILESILPEEEKMLRDAMNAVASNGIIKKDGWNKFITHDQYIEQLKSQQ